MKETNVPLTPAEGGEYSSGDKQAPAASNKRSRFAHIAAVFFLINIIVLYVLHFADRGSSSDSSSGAVAGEFKADGLSATSIKASAGAAVSFGADGQLRVGAGTTAYLDAATIPADKAYSYIRFAPMGIAEKFYDSNIMSYQTGVAPEIESTVTTFTADVAAKTIEINAAGDKATIKGASIKGLATLSDSSAVVLYSVSSADGMAITVYTAPATIADGKVAVLQDQKKMAANNSATNFITRVSESTFAMVFYEPYSETAAWNQRVQVGTVKDSKLTISKSVVFGKPNSDSASTTVGQPQSVFNSSDRFTVPWFVDDMSATKDNVTVSGSVGLCLSTYTYDAKASNLTMTEEACQTQYQPAYFIDSAKVSDNVLAFIFVDRANKFALTVALVEFSDITGTATFRGSYVFDDATGAFDFGAAYGFYPKPSVRVLSNNRMSIGFLNPSNSGKPSVKVLKFSSDLSIDELSPAMPISNADFSVASADPNAFGGIVMDMIPLTSGFVVAYAGSWAGTQQQRVSIVEAFGKPVGLVSKVDGSDLNVAMSGTVDVDTSLTAGRAYYSGTDGKLYAASTNTDDEFVLANDNKVVLSKDSLVGVAVSGSKLFVSAQAN